MKIKNFDSLLNGIFSPTDDFNVDILENESEYIVNAFLPGVKKEAINVMYENDILSIYLNTDERPNNQEYKKVRQESKDFSKMRSFCIPRVILENSCGSFIDGILSLKLPKEKLVNNNYSIKID